MSEWRAMTNRGLQVNSRERLPEEQQVEPDWTPRRIDGAPPVFDKVDIFLAAANDYIKWAEENPITRKRKHAVGKTVVEYDEELPRPLSRRGFAAFVGCGYSVMTRLGAKTDPEWEGVVSAVFNYFDNQMIEGGLVGIFHGNMVARLQKLEDHTVSRDMTPPDERRKPVPPPDENHLAVHIHPDDDQPLNLPRPLYSRAQLELGAPFTPPPHDFIEGD